MSTVTGLQLRIARFALRWSVKELAALSRVSSSTIKRIELDDALPNSTLVNVTAVKNTLEAAGIEFIGGPDNGPGIRIHDRSKLTATSSQ